MQITPEMQCYMDYDWFAVDTAGHIAHFASGRGRLPLLACSSAAEQEYLAGFFRKLPERTHEMMIPASTQASVDSLRNPDADLSDFAQFSRKGLYSYDIVQVVNMSCGSYRMVSFPGQFIHISELPVQVQELVGKLRMNSVFTALELLDIDATWPAR